MIFLKGILLGLAIAAPVGAMGLLCINKTLVKGKKEGMIAGIGIATADFVYAIIAIFLYSIVAIFLKQYQVIISIVGSVVLIFLGLSFIFKKSSTQSSDTSLAKTFFQTFLLTLSNPTTIFSFVAIVASISALNSWSLALGIFSGSLIWWLILTSVVSLIKNVISEKTIRIINIISGAVIILFGFINLMKVF